MPDVVRMKASSNRWHDAAERWRSHQRRCATCRACTCDPPNPVELCDDGAALAAAVDEAADSYRADEARQTGWRY